MRLARAAALTLAAAGILVAAAPPASAADPICRVVRVGDGEVVDFTVCVTVDVVEVSRGTYTVTLHFTCQWLPNQPSYPTACDGTGTSLDRTGFAPSRTGYSAPAVDPATGSVRVEETDIGTLFIDGTAYPVVVDGFCVGEPAFCA